MVGWYWTRIVLGIHNRTNTVENTIPHHVWLLSPSWIVRKMVYDSVVNTTSVLDTDRPGGGGDSDDFGMEW